MERELLAVLSFFAFWLGACIASFLNVVIWRVPRGESIVRPASHCPRCGTPIRWWQNIPIVAWLALRGKCARCRAPISPRYILVETLGGVLFLAAFRVYAFAGPVEVFGAFPAAVLVMWTWIALMIAGAFIDFDHQLLPDFTTVGGMALGIGYWTVVSLGAGGWTFRYDWTSFYPLFRSLGGLALGFGLLGLIRFFGSKAFGREAMGMGDVFLMGAVGALFGPVAVLATLILSSLAGSAAGLAMMAASKAFRRPGVAIPYGPFICLGCLAWMFWGGELLRWYLNLLRP